MKKIIIKLFRIFLPTRLKSFFTNKIADIARQVYAEECSSKVVIPTEKSLLTPEITYQETDKLKGRSALTMESFEQKNLRPEETDQNETEDLLSHEEYLNLQEVAHRKFSEQPSEYKNKLSGYAHGAESVLELGCGEGEFLLYLKDKFGEVISVTGVDANEAMAGKTRSKNINCISKDALSALEALPNNSQDAIYALHIIEHLNNKYLRNVLNECFRCLKKQGYLVIETPNTQSLYVLSHYYFRDATHQIPRHPSLILYLLECIGFHETQIDFLDRPNEELMLVKHGSLRESKVVKRLDELMFSAGNNVLITGKKI